LCGAKRIAQLIGRELAQQLSDPFGIRSRDLMTDPAEAKPAEKLMGIS